MEVDIFYPEAVCMWYRQILGFAVDIIGYVQLRATLLTHGKRIFLPPSPISFPIPGSTAASASPVWGCHCGRRWRERRGILGFAEGTL